MVTVAGDAVRSEGDEQVRSDRRDDVGDAADGGFSVDQIAFAVAVADHSDVMDADLGQAGTQLALPVGGEVGLVVVGRIRRALLAPGEGEHRHRAAGVGHSGHQPRGEVGLVVGMRPDPHDVARKVGVEWRGHVSNLRKVSS